MGGWLSRILSQDDADKEATEPSHSMTRVLGLLNDIGLMRLDVRNPRMKVALTQIARLGDTYLQRVSSAGTPSDIDVMKFQEQLVALARVLEKYSEIERDLDLPNRDELLRKGLEAASSIASLVVNATAPGGTQQMTDFHVDTGILSAQKWS